jgi:hypothetical protein
MNESAIDDHEPTLLKVLLRARHWQKHSTFVKEWDKVARSLDSQLVGSWPRHAQFYRWLRGDLRELPYPDACRVLEAMFPQCNVKALFGPCPQGTIANLNSHGSKTFISNREVDPLNEAGLSGLWPRTSPDVLEDLTARVNNAHEDISVFGLSRNFYGEDDMLLLVEDKASQIPVTFYVMDPQCESRRDRYRIEPLEAAMEEAVSSGQCISCFY